MPHKKVFDAEEFNDMKQELYKLRAEVTALRIEVHNLTMSNPTIGPITPTQKPLYEQAPYWLNPDFKLVVTS
ncbi:MAG: hypothetical protein JHC33_03930 [Ignisphaera sp.]|nr:hypothetical protein [Ignisphaera sp.]